MAWQLIYKADDDGNSFDERPNAPTPAPRKPVSMTLQLDEPGTTVVVPAAGDDDDDVD